MQLKHSQNFYTNINVLSKLILKANFQKEDTVIDIGAGEGIITKELIKYSNNVIAIEKDINLYNKLIKELKDSKIEIFNIDIKEFEYPKKQFKVFSNIPFNQSSDILKSLLSNSNFQQGYLFLQKETYQRYAGDTKEKKYTLQSIICSIDFNISKEHLFNRNDFVPTPNVDIYLVKFDRKEPEIKINEKPIFLDFVSYIFNNSTPNIEKTHLFTDKQLDIFKRNIKVNRNDKPSQISYNQYLELFKVVRNTEKIEKVKEHYNKQNNQSRDINKVYRTRNDKKWRFK